MNRYEPRIPQASAVGVCQYDHSRESGYETILTNIGNRAVMIRELQNCISLLKRIASETLNMKGTIDAKVCDCEDAINSVVRNGDLYENRHDAFVAFNKLKPIPIWVPEDGIPCAECVSFDEWIWLPVAKGNRYFKSQHEKFMRGESEERQ